MNQRLSNAPTTQRSRGATRAGRCLHDERGTRARAPSSEGCMTDTGTNDSGLGIITRHQTRNDTIMERVREIASTKGLDLAVRDAVQQPLDCDVTEIVELPRLRHRVSSFSTTGALEGALAVDRTIASTSSGDAWSSSNTRLALSNPLHFLVEKLWNRTGKSNSQRHNDRLEDCV